MAGTADRKRVQLLVDKRKGATQINVNLNVTINHMGDLRAALDALKKFDLLVGVPSDEDRQRDMNGSNARKDSEVTNALLAYVHNNGSPAQNIPARSTIEPGIIDAKDKITTRYHDAAEHALDGDLTAINNNLVAAGLEAQSAVKNRIRSNTPPPLKARTIAARIRRGHLSTRTLVETGAYLNAHTFVVREKV
jgi:hypothetical protein